MVLCDPELLAQALDRSKYPEFIDKPPDAMFYKIVDEVRMGSSQVSSPFLGVLPYKQK